MLGEHQAAGAEPPIVLNGVDLSGTRVLASAAPSWGIPAFNHTDERRAPGEVSDEHL